MYADGPDAQEDAVVHMFRSWTGDKMAELKIKVPLDEEGEFVETDSRITEITREASLGGRRNWSQEEAKAMAREVCNWIMDVSIEIR